MALFWSNSYVSLSNANYCEDLIMVRASALKHFLFLVFVSATAWPNAWANEMLQFGVIFPADFRAGSALEPGQGFGIHTFVVGNLGTTPLSLSDFVFSSSIASTTTTVDPLVDVRVNDGGFVLAPGQALGYINGDFNQPLTLSFVQSIFPTISSLSVQGGYGLFASFDNPLGSGVVFQDTQTTVDYHLRYGGANSHWMTSYEVGVPDLQTGTTAGVLGYGVSNAAGVPEASTVTLMGVGLFVLGLRRMCERGAASCLNPKFCRIF